MRANPINIKGIDPMLAIASDNVPGMSHVNKFGANSAIADAATEDVWDGSNTYTFTTTADITHITQAVDQVAMRSGIIEVQGLDTNWDSVTQNVTLDGSDTTTAVALTTPLKRVFRMKVLADVVTTQDINLKNFGGGITYAIIQAGNNQTLMAIYTVPNGKTAYITKHYGDAIETVAAGKPDSTEFKLWVADRDNTYEFQLKHAIGLPKQAPLMEYCFMPYLKVTQKSDIKITASPVGDSVSCHAGFDLILVDN